MAVRNLERARISAYFDDRLASAMDSVRCYDSIGSTNDELMTAPAPEPGRYALVVADHQTAGRGRAGKPWLLPPGAGICLSLMTTLGTPAENIAPLTLAVGVGIASALRTMGAGVELKWPNDLVLADKKLGGILVERRDHAAGSTVVIGVGINVWLPPGFGDEWSQFAVLPPGDLASALAVPVGRNALAARVTQAIANSVRRFEVEDTASFVAAWAKLDFLAGRRLVVETGREPIEGVGAGIASDGALRVAKNNGDIVTTHVGSVSLA